MTREEAIKMLKYNSNVIHQTINGETDHKEVEALDMAIKALEQEPCEDAVSRTEITDEPNRLGRNAFKDDTDYDNFFAFLDSLPSVTPTRKKGKWIPCRANEECPLRESEDKE